MVGGYHVYHFDRIGLLYLIIIDISRKHFSMASTAPLVVAFVGQHTVDVLTPSCRSAAMGGTCKWFPHHQMLLDPLHQELLVFHWSFSDIGGKTAVPRS